MHYPYTKEERRMAAEPWQEGIDHTLEVAIRGVEHRDEIFA